MPIFEFKEYKIPVDDEGFMENPGEWTKDLALALASTENLTELTDNHWKLIDYIRGYHEQYGIAPMIRKMCKETGFQLKEIYDMFSFGPAKGACKVAGLNKPTGCV